MAETRKAPLFRRFLAGTSIAQGRVESSGRTRASERPRAAHRADQRTSPVAPAPAAVPVRPSLSTAATAAVADHAANQPSHTCDR